MRVESEVMRVESGVMRVESGVMRVESGEWSYGSRKHCEVYQYLCEEKREFVLSKQILRSGTSIGANLAEAECAISKKDFLSKIYIALKECSETLYWLELLTETDYLSEQEFKSLNADCDELRRMLSATTKTISSAQQK